MTDRKKLIEVALPLEAINEASAREKSIRHGHPSTLHLWWARRPLAACRAVIFTSLVDDPDNPNAPEAFVAACKKLPKGKNAAESDTPRQRLFDFIERLVTWEATTDDALLEQARELIRLSTDGYPPPLLDPFAGGGSIPLEAQRLGLEAHASDLNPVAVMINKAMIEIPPLFKDQPPVNPRDRAMMGANTRWKGAAGLAADVRYYGEWMREQAWERIGHLYPQCNGETVVAWLWARTVKCPNPACNKLIPLVRSFDLSRKKTQSVWLEPNSIFDNQNVLFSINKEKKSKRHPGSVDRHGAECLACGTPATLDFIRDEAQAGRMDSQLIAIVTDGDNGRNFYVANKHHEDIGKTVTADNRPNTPLSGKTRVSVPLYGMETHADLFTDRQIKALNYFTQLVQEVREKMVKDCKEFNFDILEPQESKINYIDAVIIYLSFAVSKLTDRNSTIATWDVGSTSLRNTFSRQAIPMTWDYCEANPFASMGSLEGAIDWIIRVLEKLPCGKNGYAKQLDARYISNGHRNLISTDPPYYDNIEYADLSDYFYIWLRKNLIKMYPNLFSTILVPKTGELIASKFRFDDFDESRNYFEEGLKSTFDSIKSSLNFDYPLSVYYAFKQEELVAQKDVVSTGWETILNSLIEKGYVICGTWPMRTELGHRSVASGANALASSIVLVCRINSGESKIKTRRDFVAELREEVPLSIKQMQSGNIAPVDLAQAAIGPGMAVYSRYSKVLEPDGSELTVRTALQLINQVLDEYLAEQEGAMDQASRFAVTWFSQYGFDAGPYGQAEVLSKAKDTSVEGMARHGVLKAEAGKVRLLRWDELDPGQSLQSGMVWAATHLLIERLNTHGETGAAKLLASLPPDLAADARALAYRLYSIADRKGWSSLARHYNALVVSWSEAQEEARSIRKDTPRQGTLFEDES
jgi:putative DNA methylase